MTRPFLDNLTPLPFRGGLGPGPRRDIRFCCCIDERCTASRIAFRLGPGRCLPAFGPIPRALPRSFAWPSRILTSADQSESARQRPCKSSCPDRISASMTAISRRQCSIHSAPPPRSCFTCSKLRPFASSWARLPVSCCQRSTTTSTYFSEDSTTRRDPASQGTRRTRVRS